jgi:hypothetical protein
MSNQSNAINLEDTSNQDQPNENDNSDSVDDDYLNDDYNVIIAADLEKIKPELLLSLQETYPDKTEAEYEVLMNSHMSTIKHKIMPRKQQENLFKSKMSAVDAHIARIGTAIENLQSLNITQTRINITARKYDAFHSEGLTLLKSLDQIALEGNMYKYDCAQQDWLLTQYGNKMNELADLNAEFLETIKDKAPEVYKEIRPIPHSTNVTVSSKKTALHYDVTKYISEKFDGDEKDPNCVRKYDSWLASWNLLYADLKKCEDFEDTLAFDRLKATLTGSALQHIQSFSAIDPNSYENAKKWLHERFCDRLALAKSNLTLLGKMGQTKYEYVDNLESGLNGISAIRKSFVDDKLDIVEFFILFTIEKDMPSDLRKDFLEFCETRRQQVSQSLGATSPVDMSTVYNTDTIRLWIRQINSTRKADRESNQMKEEMIPSSTADASFRVQDDPNNRLLCQCCEKFGHKTTDCRRALSMTRTAWYKNCTQLHRCSRCLFKPWTREHNPSCQGKCSICNQNHFVTQCPSNPKRSKPIFDEIKKPFPHKQNPKSSDPNNVTLALVKQLEAANKTISELKDKDKRKNQNWRKNPAKKPKMDNKE